MSDPTLPPPRQPMPERLRHRITEELAVTTSRRRRGPVVVPLVAAAVVTALVVVGVTAVRDRQSVFPAETATAVPATTPPTPTASPSTSATAKPTPKPVLSVLDVRPMTKAEIAKDQRSCVRPAEGDGSPLPYQGRAEVQYAMVQRTADAAGAGAPIRVLLAADEIGHWTCLDGQQDGWTRGARTATGLSSRVPAAPMTNSGGSGASCSPERHLVRSSGTFAVRRAVVTGRVRVLRGKQAGPWMTIEPVDGIVHIAVKVTDPAADERDVRVEYGFLDRDGRTVRVASGYDDGKTSSAHVTELSTCVHLRERMAEHRPKPVRRPRSDAAGLRTCRAMVAESAERQDVASRGNWASRLLVSTPDEWGMVLGDGRKLVGCSLYPTKEISPFIPDTPVVAKSAFSFAVNPIGVTGTASLWAAGRVPADVSAITYRLPGERDVAATLDDGYWMLKYHSEDGRHIGTAEDSADWPPVVVTVTRPSGSTRFTIPFTEGTMCRQVSHGC